MTYGLAFSLLDSTAAAEDAAQEVFIRVAKTIRGFKQQSSLKSWLHRITLNIVYDSFRKQKRVRNLTERVADPTDPMGQEKRASPPSQLEIKEALLSLSFQDRAARSWLGLHGGEF